MLGAGQDYDHLRFSWRVDRQQRVDRELYLPRSWAEEPERRAAAGVPDEIEFATKPALATAMIARGVAAGLPTAWVTADEVYGIDPDLRTELETLQLGYVLGLGCNRRVTVHGARGGVRMRRRPDAGRPGRRRAG